MAPFWSGIAIGIMIGVPIFILCVIAGLFLATWRAIDEGVHDGTFARAWREGQTHNSARGAQWRARMDARTQRLWQSRERQLAWMEHHFGFRTLARLNRWLGG